MATITITVDDELIPEDVDPRLQIQMALGEVPWLEGLALERIEICKLDDRNNSDGTTSEAD